MWIVSIVVWKMKIASVLLYQYSVSEPFSISLSLTNLITAATNVSANNQQQYSTISVGRNLNLALVKMIKHRRALNKPNLIYYKS